MSEPQIPQKPAAWLLDLTRLMSRVGRGPMTGIDRVESAYLSKLLTEDTVLFGLVRTSLGFVLLDRKGISAVQDRVQGKVDWGPPGLLSFLFLKSNKLRQSVETDLRKLSIQRATSYGLSRMLVRRLPKGSVWLNVGHTNLSAVVFDAVHKVKDARAHIMIHDMIPIIYPQYQRPGTVELFKTKMRCTSEKADLAIYNSRQSQRDAEQVFSKWGRIPQARVAHLGIERILPSPALGSDGPMLSQPYFIVTGTIEPRKNHALLLDVWAHLNTEGQPAPQLVIIGNRGWNNEALFKRLDAKPDSIIELNNVDDATMAALVKGARAALFPSLAEGFGLPPCEAVLLGTTIVANDLGVTREILGNIPIYANALDMYSWVQIIRELIATSKKEQSKKERAIINSSLPTWQDHFNLVLTMK